MNSDISKPFLLFGTQRSCIVLKGYTFSKERERDCVGGKEPCLGQIVVRCAGFESGEVVEFGKVPRPEGFWPL